MTVESRTEVLRIPVPGTTKKFERVSDMHMLPGNDRYTYLNVASGDSVCLIKSNGSGPEFKYKQDINKAKIRSGNLLVGKRWVWKPSRRP